MKFDTAKEYVKEFRVPNGVITFEEHWHVTEEACRLVWRFVISIPHPMLNEDFIWAVMIKPSKASKSFIFELFSDAMLAFNRAFKGKQ